MAMASALARCLTLRYCGPIHKRRTAVSFTVLQSISHDVDKFSKRLESVRMYSRRTRSIDRYMSANEKLINSRALLRSALPIELIRAVGVSFQQRQEAVAHLSPGQPVCFVQEPDNPVDPNAVAITSLSDVPLGYVPKSCTGPFIHRVCFGLVCSVGQAENSTLYGFTAEVQPRVPPITVLALPEEVADVCIHLTRTLSGSRWDVLESQIIIDMNRQCSLSAVPTENIVARWEVDDKDRVVRLLGFALQAPELTTIENMLIKFSDHKNLDVWQQNNSTVETLCLLNGWKDCSDGLTYLKRRQVLQMERSRPTNNDRWSLDLSYLVQRGVDLVPEVARYVR